jgi:hypothetical protein
MAIACVILDGMALLALFSAPQQSASGQDFETRSATLSDSANA